MTTTAASAFVFKDEAGDFFLLPHPIMDQYRVTEEQRAVIARAFDEARAAAPAAHDDTDGYFWPVIWGIQIGIGAAVAIGYGNDSLSLVLADAVNQIQGQMPR